MHGRNEKRIQNLVRKREGKRPLGRLRSRWVDNIRMDLGEIVWKVVECLHLAHGRV